VSAPRSAVVEQATSGEQHEIRHGDQVAVACEVGGTLRLYTARGIDVIDGFGTNEQSVAGRGQVLAPWPNRLDGGTYEFEGSIGRAALDEPERGNAIHGLVRWAPWTVRSISDSAVALGCVIHPQPAYPWHTDLEVEYSLDEDGLTTTVRAVNLSDAPAPFGIGFHSYLTVGEQIDGANLRVPARQRLVTDERGLPTGESLPVQGTSFDFMSGRGIGETRLDTAYTGLIRDGDERARTVIGSRDGTRRHTLWTGPEFPFLMVYTGDTLEPASRRRQGIAVEPMTCPPNAFRSGRNVIRLATGESWSGTWGIRPGFAPNDPSHP
jgi:aldose 1-epimerase